MIPPCYSTYRCHLPRELATPAVMTSYSSLSKISIISAAVITCGSFWKCLRFPVTKRRNFPCSGRLRRRLGRPHLAFRQHKENGTNQWLHIPLRSFLNRLTSLISSLFIMTIVGGAVAPVIMGYIADTTGSMAIAFLIPLVCYGVIGGYALLKPSASL